MAAGEAGMHMLRIQPDGQLVPVTTFHFGGNTLRIALGSDGFLYSANESAGMAMFLFEETHLYFPQIAQGRPLKLYFPWLGKK